MPDWPLLAAAVLATLSLGEATAVGVQPGQKIALPLVLGLFATLPLLLARRYPVAAAIVITAATLLLVVSHHPPTIAGTLAMAAVQYVVGRQRDPRLAGALVLPYVGFAIAPFGWAVHYRVLAVLLLTVVGAAAALGSSARMRAEARSHDASRREMRTTLLEYAARGERARIARELHDVVAHHISMIAVQAETARLTTPGMPEEGAQRLSAIGDTARTALTEMRRLLGVLREDAGPAEPTRAPQPGLEQLNELIDEARAAAPGGTRLIVRGHVQPLDPGVQLTVYRIVQEALTNARRHAPGAAVDVELDYRADRLLLRVRDNGPGAPETAEPGGHGLLGMRERALMVGGELWAGPAPGSGFLVEAALPVPETPS
ncbi:MAG: sensor histidine kinase [Micromonosporaceae bacterium]|nr:sensor histidine kinase [Micromonosporaceae bacterium]